MHCKAFDVVVVHLVGRIYRKEYIFLFVFVLIVLHLYLCVQLYIQESVTVGKMSELAALSPSHIPQITWAPVSATGMVRVCRQVLVCLLLS
jgi:uncharacterized membrane protein YhaH (DUF805 family)